MKYDRRDGEYIGKLEKTGNGVFLEITDILFVVGEGFEVVFEGVKFEGLETFASEFLCLRDG